MANLLQSSQDTATTAPSYYTNYLSNLATAGTQAGNQAQFVGAQPLQEKAFQNVEQAAGSYQPTLQTAGQTLGSATSAASPLASATPYLSSAMSDPSQAAAGYMTPYIRSVVDALGDTGARNIRQNLAPLATSGAVGSGQFGSKRGAEVLGQTISNADRDILNAQAQAMNTGYQNALQAAIQQNQIANQAGSTAANAASSGQQNLTQAGRAQSDLAGQEQALGLSGINALSTMGGQQQTIAQNEQNFPLTNLSNVASLMRGFTVPTSTSTTMQASPLSTLAGLATGTAGFFTPGTTGVTPYDAFTSGLSTLGSKLGLTGGNTTLPGSATDESGYTDNPFDAPSNTIPAGAPDYSQDQSDYTNNIGIPEDDPSYYEQQG
jgi:hypothetical protein